MLKKVRKKVNVFGLFFVAGLAVGCSGSNNAQSDSTEPVGSTVEATVGEKEAPTTTDRKQVDVKTGGEPMERYEAYLEAYDVAVGPPYADPNYAPLLELVTGQEREAVDRVLKSLVEDEVVIVYPESSVASHEFSGIGGMGFLEETELYEFIDCRISDEFEEALNGEPITDGGVFTYARRVEMQKVDGEWKVKSIARQDKYEGQQKCEKYYVAG